jgi:hypothetical protein
MSHDYRFRHLVRVGAALRDDFLKAKAGEAEG